MIYKKTIFKTTEIILVNEKIISIINYDCMINFMYEQKIIKNLLTHGQVVSQELHDKSAVFVRVLTKTVQFGNGVIKSL